MQFFRFKFSDGSYSGTDWHSEADALEARAEYLEIVDGNPSDHVQAYAKRYAAAQVVELDRETRGPLVFGAIAGMIGIQSSLIIAGAQS